MTTHREILSAALSLLGDTTMRSITELFGLQLAEVTQALTLARSKSRVATVPVPFVGPSVVPGQDTIPVTNLRTVSALADYFIPVNVRLSGRSLDRVHAERLLPFADAWLTTGTVTEHYFVGNNLLGLRKSPAAPTNVDLTYVPYVVVNDLDDPIVLRDEYRDALRMLMLAFLFLRVSRFDLAKRELQHWSTEVDDATTRIVRARIVA